MSDLKELQNMAKNGEFSNELMRDGNFKSDFKRSVKEEGGVEINDDQIKEIVKNFENTLQDKEALEEANLENVSGGAETPKLLRIGLGVVGWYACSNLAGYGARTISKKYINSDRYNEYIEAINKVYKDKNMSREQKHNAYKKLDKEYEDVFSEKIKTGLGVGGIGLLSGAAGAVGGVKLADWIYKKYSERKNKAEFELEDE